MLFFRFTLVLMFLYVQTERISAVQQKSSGGVTLPALISATSGSDPSVNQSGWQVIQQGIDVWASLGWDKHFSFNVGSLAVEGCMRCKADSLKHRNLRRCLLPVSSILRFVLTTIFWRRCVDLKGALYIENFPVAGFAGFISLGAWKGAMKRMVGRVNFGANQPCS